jgi:deoxyribose-phosphate aldolase
MEAGADFIKTSTGKEKVSASLEAVYIMCHAIRNFYHASGKAVGIKPAGGIAEARDAVNYYSLVEMILGKEWLLPESFRIGASRLANSLLSEVEGRNVDYF